MPRREAVAELEKLVDGELGQAVLYGLYCLMHSAMDEVISLEKGMRYAPIVRRARRAAAEYLTIPDSVPPEARDEWRTTAVEAVDYFLNFMPPGLGDD